jgi:aspartyl-tRNA(Asn)/glutamyl-tRNA(Gln) amidotransferase subunit A
MDLSNLTATELVQQLSSGDLTATDCTDFYLKRIAASRSLNAFVDIAGDAKNGGDADITGDGESSLAKTAKMARQRAAAIDSKQVTGPLAGLPIAIKDGICTSGIHTTASSRMLKNFVPSFDATCVAQLNAAAAINVGKTNLDEFAMGSSTENSFFGPSLNPFNTDHVPGGSSGGSAVAVAAGLAPVALGSDTGGSIRQPASFCGITGLKPTYGRVSRFGLIAFASSLDQIGPMARSAADCALAMNYISGHDPHDSTSAKEATPDFTSDLNQPIAGLKIGVYPQFFADGIDPAVEASVREAIQVYESLGAQIVEIDLPHSAAAVATYYVIAPCEASSNLSRYDGVRYTHRAAADSLDPMYMDSRAEGFGAEVKRRVILGTYALSSGYYDAYYLQASKVRRMIKHDFDQAFKQVDMILGPTTPTTAFQFGQHTQDPLAMYLADIFTVSANLAGIPAISLPCGMSAGLPIGLHLQGKAFDEVTLLRAAHQFQQTTQWHQQRPELDPEVSA